ncbi:cobW-domain-containing protein [Myriangium duriaei CBS 260.36]|uniref:CobW-domain-containing protein n=1 Tax=Myriangium duriaei CBS 260.36 TaxID=1168546 RepID=A0A9P4J3I2_9PEZI|nr:cobW-domain-containing protein [Myriangium duriaei CBS 260.36]
MTAPTSARAKVVPITIITGFVGTGKTTLLLNLLPQLRRIDPSYRLSLIKNEIGDLAVDSALAASAELAGARELLGNCICCAQVGQLGSALEELLTDDPDRVVIETSGSAEPIKLVVEINRLARETGRYVLDGVVGVVDVMNWEGYSSTSYTAKLQAQQTDLVVLNKWEEAGEERLDRVLDRLGDMDVETPQVKSDKGWVSVELLFGLDGKMVKGLVGGEEEGHGHHNHDHNEEMECLSVSVESGEEAEVDLAKLDTLLQRAPKDEVFRIKAILYSKTPPPGVEVEDKVSGSRKRYILNWSFGRHNWTADSNTYIEGPLLRMSMFLARYESNKWTKKLESGQFVALNSGTETSLSVKRVL